MATGFKIITSILLLSAFISIQAAAQEYQSVVNEIISLVNKDSLMNTVNILSGEKTVMIAGKIDSIKSRWWNEKDNDKAADYLEEQLSGYGLEPVKMQYSQTGRNIYAIQPGTSGKEEYYIIGGHYDDLNADKPSISPGAEDNAAGCSGVLEAARVLSKFKLKYPVIYIFFDEEELGFLGSTPFVRKMKDEKYPVRAYFNLDMLGWDDNSDGNTLLKYKNIGESVNYMDTLKNLNTIYTLEIVPTPQLVTMIDGTSDMDIFWDYGYSALSIHSTYDHSEVMHSGYDLAKLINPDALRQRTQWAAAALAFLAGADYPDGVEEALPGNAEPGITAISPNPFGNTAEIGISIKSPGNVRITIHDILGSERAVLFDGLMMQGNHSFTVNPSATGLDLPAGTYFCRMESGGRSVTRKMVYIGR